MKTKDEKKKIGQFLTSAPIAKFMAAMFTKKHDVILLDPGAGHGALTDAVIDSNLDITSITHYETDSTLFEMLNEKYSGRSFNYELVTSDFIESGSDLVNWRQTPFTHVIMNPPYKKINSNSKHRKALRAVEIETVNLYSAFVALALLLLKENGELVAIIPRSFCNGPYYKPFRELIFKAGSIDKIHLFDSRNDQFKEEDVLQENIIIKLSKRPQVDIIEISHSMDSSFTDLKIEQRDFKELVKPECDEGFIHIPSWKEEQTIELYSTSLNSFSSIGLQASTGPVVDFRMKSDLIYDADIQDVPLLYPGHFQGRKITWPKEEFKKPNAIRLTAESKKWLYSSAGSYVVVNRFSAKEEKRRVVANVVDCSTFESEWIGFENHLNVFHESKHGFDKYLALGLAAYLNSSLVDNYVRQFSGHTQINVTDLKNLKYPDRNTLISLGHYIDEHHELSDETINRKVVDLLEHRIPHKRSS